LLEQPSQWAKAKTKKADEAPSKENN
jgi:hypothetical protein